MAPYPNTTDRKAGELIAMDKFLERMAREDERIDREFWERVNYGTEPDKDKEFDWPHAIIGAFVMAGTVAVVLLAGFGMAHQSGWLM